MRNLLLIIIALLLLWQIPTYKGFDSSNEYSRLYLSTALARGFRLHIDPEIVEFGDIIDKASRNNIYYSDKAPISSIIAWPASLISILALKATGSTFTREKLLTLVRYLTLIPLTMLFLSLYLHSLKRYGFDEKYAFAGIVLLVLGTPFGVYSTLYYGHVMAAWMLFSAWVIVALYKQPPGGIVGFLCGLAIGTEFPAALAAFVIMGFASAKIIREKVPKNLAMMLIGLAIPGLIVAFVNYFSFGHPFATGYMYKSLPHDAAVHAQGFMGFSLPSAESIYGVLISPSRGLFFYSPILLFAIPGAIRMRGAVEKPHQEAFIVAGIVAIVHILLTLCFVDWQAGWSYAPRHMVPVIPFLIPLVVISLKHGGRVEKLLVLAAAIYSAVFTLMALGTFPHVPTALENPARELFLRLISEGIFTHSLLMLAGVPGWVSVGIFTIIFFAVFGMIFKNIASAPRIAAACVLSVALLAAAMAPVGEYENKQRLAMAQVYLALEKPRNAAHEYEDIFQAGDTEFRMRLFAGMQLLEVYKIVKDDVKLKNTALEMKRLISLKKKEQEQK